MYRITVEIICAQQTPSVFRTCKVDIRFFFLVIITDLKPIFRMTCPSSATSSFTKFLRFIHVIVEVILSGMRDRDAPCSRLISASALDHVGRTDMRTVILIVCRQCPLQRSTPLGHARITERLIVLLIEPPWQKTEHFRFRQGEQQRVFIIYDHLSGRIIRQKRQYEVAFLFDRPVLFTQDVSDG